MEWEAPAIVLDARLYGESDAIVTVIAEQHGSYRGLVRGGVARSQAATWQRGNFVSVRWTARLPDQLGGLRGELIHPVAALVMDDPLALATLTAVCAVAEGALPEREPHPAIFEGMLRLLARLPEGAYMLSDLVRWETLVLAELGYGLDLRACAVTGATAGLAYVSPRTGRAVTAEAAGDWAARLLALPSFLVGGNTASAREWMEGLRLTGHFLARDAFGHYHKPLPQARLMLYDRVAAMATESDPPHEDHDAG
jgi:DNA repair protein RecO (recombination protein O)